MYNTSWRLAVSRKESSCSAAACRPSVQIVASSQITAWRRGLVPLSPLASTNFQPAKMMAGQMGN